MSRSVPDQKASDQTATEPREGLARLSNLNLMPRRVYRLRMLGMGLAALPIAVVLDEIAAPMPSWLWLLFTALVWPQLALLIARRSRDPYRAELRNLMFDSALAGIWAPLMQFNLLPSTLLITLATVDKINTGIRGLWLWSLPGLLGGLLGVGMLTGFAARPETSMPVLLACLPMLLIHTIVVSLASYQLVRKVQRQNRMLDELSRIDVLTGLEARRHWQDRAEQLLQQFHREGGEMYLLLIDVDHFKQINDEHGHAVGDDVLRSIATVVRRQLGEHGHAGRYGGDEFAVLMVTSQGTAEAIAESIRDGVERLRIPQVPALRCSVSLGLAAASANDLGLREWIESADRALYRAKGAGRNRIGAAAIDAQPATG